jgi:hypothetical protein
MQQLTLAGSVEEHEAVFRSDEQVDAPECRAQDLRVEPLFVFSKYKEMCVKYRCFSSGLDPKSIRSADPESGSEIQIRIQEG